MAKSINLSGISPAVAARIAAEQPRLPVEMKGGRFDDDTRKALGRYMLDEEISVLERINQGQGDGFLLFPDGPATASGQTATPSAAPPQRITRNLSLTEASRLFREDPETYAQAAADGFVPKVSA